MSTDDKKMAPVQGYSAGIPWAMHLRAYDAYCKKFRPQRDLIEGWCRGGFGTEELDMLIPGWREELSEVNQLQQQLSAAHARITELEKQRDRYPMYSVTRIKELEAALTAHEESLGAAQAEIADLKNAGGPPFIRSEAIRNLKDDLASSRAKLEKARADLRLASDSIASLLPLAELANDVEPVGGPDDPCAVNLARGVIESATSLVAYFEEAALAPVVERGAEQKEGG